MKRCLSVRAAVVCLAPMLAAAAELGDPAPALQVAEWVKGQPVDLAAGKSNTIFVVEFWATWCPPCRASIPHLTKLQQTYKDKNVTVVGISTENAAKVKPFVKEQGDKMDYRVAIDKDNATSKGYMEAFGIEGIPHAFVVDKAGRIAWHGHPMMGLDQTLEQVVAGTFDPATARKRSDAQSKLEAFFALASEGGDEAKLDAMAGELEALDKELGGIMPNGKRFDAAELKKGVRVQGLVREYALALKKGDEARTAELEKQIEGNAPKDFDFPKFKEAIQVQVLWEQYYRAVSSGAADADKVAALAKKLGAMKITNAQVLNELAWTLLTDEEIKDRDLALALKLAQAAYDASKGKEGHIVDTYARALFDNGKVAEAVAQQKKAIDLCKDEPDLVKDLTATLQKYEAKAAAK